MWFDWFKSPLPDQIDLTQSAQAYLFQNSPNLTLPDSDQIWKQMMNTLPKQLPNFNLPKNLTVLSTIIKQYLHPKSEMGYQTLLQAYGLFVIIVLLLGFLYNYLGWRLSNDNNQLPIGLDNRLSRNNELRTSGYRPRNMYQSEGGQILRPQPKKPTKLPIFNQ